MKKTLALIISVILVIAIFASCTPEDIEAAAVAADEIEIDVPDFKTDIEELKSLEKIIVTGENEENCVPGFFVSLAPPRGGGIDIRVKRLDIGSEIPRRSPVFYIGENRKLLRFDYSTDGSSRHTRRTFIFYSHKTNYTVKEMGISRIFLPAISLAAK